MTIELFIPGVPVPKGSARAFYIKKLHRAVVVQDNSEKQQPWVSFVSLKSEEAGMKISDRGMDVNMIFVMPRPKSHFRSNGKLREDAPRWHVKKPDLDKLQRAVLDALTSIAWTDDSQVCNIKAIKIYGDIPGLRLQVSEV